MAVIIISNDIAIITNKEAHMDIIVLVGLLSWIGAIISLEAGVL